MILAERAAGMAAEAEATHAKADPTGTEALIAHLNLAIEKLEASASGDAIAAQAAAAHASRTMPVRKRPLRRAFPAHLPRERIMIAAPTACPCCGSAKLSKLGEDVTETVEVVPRRWKVIQTVRERFSCRDCERIQPPAPFHVTPRGFAGPQHTSRSGPWSSHPSPETVPSCRRHAAARPPAHALRSVGGAVVAPWCRPRPGRQASTRLARSLPARSARSAGSMAGAARTSRTGWWPTVFATTGRSAVLTRRRRSSMPPATGLACIPSAT